VQLLLGHSKLESTVRYLAIDVDDALEIAEERRCSGSRRNLPVGTGSQRSLTGQYQPSAKRP